MLQSNLSLESETTYFERVSDNNFSVKEILFDGFVMALEILISHL